MPIDRETLINIARDAVGRRVRKDRSVVSAILSGSVLEEEFLLGGTTDIDLVFLHYDKPLLEREIQVLNDDVHLDIAHRSQREYRQPRQLRMDPWWGPTLAGCTVLHDPQHFMDFTQASVRGQFDRSDRVLGRSRKRSDYARQVAARYQESIPRVGPQDVLAYLKAVENAANAVAGLSGSPLTDRRFLLRFPERAQAVGRPGLHAGLMGLLGAPKLEQDTLKVWLPAWQAAYCALSPDAAPPVLDHGRESYYLRAIEVTLESEWSQAALWPMLRTWTEAVSQLAPGSVERVVWREVVKLLGLQGNAFFERVQALEAYLDLVDETLQSWADEQGVWNP